MKLIAILTIPDLRLTDLRTFKTTLSLTVSTVLLLAVLLLPHHDTILVPNNIERVLSIYCDENNNGGKSCDIVSNTLPQLQLQHRQQQQQRDLDEVGIQKEEVKLDPNLIVEQDENDNDVESWSRIFMVILVAVMLTAILGSLFKLWRKMQDQTGCIETHLPPLESDYDDDFTVVSHDGIDIDMSASILDRDGDSSIPINKMMTGIELV